MPGINFASTLLSRGELSFRSPFFARRLTRKEYCGLWGCGIFFFSNPLPDTADILSGILLLCFPFNIARRLFFYLPKDYAQAGCGSLNLCKSFVCVPHYDPHFVHFILIYSSYNPYAYTTNNIDSFTKFLDCVQ